MISVLNFVNPTDEIINKINIYNYTSDVTFKYLISELPHRSADIILLSDSDLYMCTAFQEFCYVPFLVYGNVRNINKSFFLGSSDFLKIPWDFNELETRVSRFLRKDELTFNNEKIFFSSESISNGSETEYLSINEYKIICLLLNNPGKIISRENIYYNLGIKNQNSRVIDVYLHSLRKKISHLSGNERKKIEIIRTIRGKGYTINSQHICG